MQSTFEKINLFIGLQSQERSIYTETYEQILKKFLSEMKTVNPLFETLYNGHFLVGSYLDKLKITNPDEFDINIKLKLPMNHSDIIIKKSKERIGYITINIKKGLDILSRQKNLSETYKELKKLTNDDGFLLQNKVHSWLECVVVKALDCFKQLYPSYQLIHTKNGPAHTLDVNKKISMDLVAGFEFNSNQHWISDRKNEYYRSIWLAIPRPNKANPSNNNNWIPAYAMLEKDIMHNKNTFKNVIRLFKKLRDNLNLFNLKSYFIKTVFMWELEVRPPNYWEKPLSEIFLNSFDILINCLQNHDLKYYWDKNYNMLLASLSVNQIDDLCIRLKKSRCIILENKETPENFINQFLNSVEHEQLRKGVRPINDDLVNSMAKLMIFAFKSSTTNSSADTTVATADTNATSVTTATDTTDATGVTDVTNMAGAHNVLYVEIPK